MSTSNAYGRFGRLHLRLRLYLGLRRANAIRRRATQALLEDLLPPVADGEIEVIEHGDGGVPVDTGVGNGHAVLQGGGAFGWDVLPAGIDVGLDHDASDAAVARSELLADVSEDLWLVVVVLLGVAVWEERVMRVRRDGGGRGYAREQSIMMDGWFAGRAFSIEHAAACTCSDP